MAKLPLFRKCISKHRPLIVFIFNDDKNLTSSDNSLNAITNMKDYLLNDDLTNEDHHVHAPINPFFDSFATNWISKFGYDDLLHSVFCSTNSNELNESYCLSVEDSLNQLRIFPAFFGKYGIDIRQKNKVNLSKRNIDENDEDDPIVEAQVLEQLHDKLYNLAKKFNDITYELAHDPKHLIKEKDNSFDQKVQDKVDSLASKKETLLLKKESLSLKKNLAIEKIKSINLVIFDNDKDYETDSDFSQSMEKIDSNPYSNIDNYNHKRNDNTEEEEFFDDEDQQHDNIGYVLPLSIIKSVENTIRAPRSRKYSQIIFDEDGKEEEQEIIVESENEDENLEQVQKDLNLNLNLELVQEHVDEAEQDSINYVPFTNLSKKIFKRSDEEDDCVRITWYNIFHYSIFGKPNFCKSNI